MADDHGGQLEHAAGVDDNPAVANDVADDNGATRSTTAHRSAGQCTGASTAKLKVKPDHSRLQTEFEVDQNRSDVTWTVTIRRNGSRVMTTNATTKGPSGALHVARRLSDRAGRDTINARAMSPSGEVCTASIAV